MTNLVRVLLSMLILMLAPRDFSAQTVRHVADAVSVRVGSYNSVAIVFRNLTDAPVFLPACGRMPKAYLERLEGARWRRMPPMVCQMIERIGGLPAVQPRDSVTTYTIAAQYDPIAGLAKGLFRAEVPAYRSRHGADGGDSAAIISHALRVSRPFRFVPRR